MKDIAPELLEKIKKSFEERMKQNGAIKMLETRLKAGEGGFEEAEEYAGEVGRALSAAFGEHLSSDVLPDGRMYFNIADRVVTPLMEEEYRLTTEAGMEAVRAANERAGIHLQGRKPAFEPDRVKGIVDRLASEESFDAVKWILGDPVESYAVHCVDETVKQNAEFLHKAGRTARIRRDSASRCCDWCAALDGVYEYPGVPREIYARHNNCTCTVEYLPGDGKAQDVWSKNSRDVSTREERRIFSERAISKEEAEERIRRAEEIKKSLQNNKKSDNLTPKDRQILVSSDRYFGRKAVPYSARGIEIDDRIVSALEELKKSGDYITRDPGYFDVSDLAVMTTEKGVEFALFETGAKQFVVRGGDRITTIPEALFDMVVPEEGVFVAHSHPFIGDLIPSADDLKTLTDVFPWQTTSIIVDPEGKAIEYCKSGVIGEVEIRKRLADFEDLFGEKE